MIGYVKRDKEKNYRLGSKLIKYANQNIQELDLVEISLPYLEALQKTADETIHLGVLTANEILYVNKLEPHNQTIRMSSKVGITRPLYSSAMGKAVLAEFDAPQVEEYLGSNAFNRLYGKHHYESVEVEERIGTGKRKPSSV